MEDKWETEQNDTGLLFSETMFKLQDLGILLHPLIQLGDVSWNIPLRWRHAIFVCPLCSMLASMENEA